MICCTRFSYARDWSRRVKIIYFLSMLSATFCPRIDGRKCKFSQVCASWLRSVEETREGIFVAKISLENKNIGRRSSVEIRSSFWGKDCFSRIRDRAREIVNVTGNKNLIQREESWSKSMRFEVISGPSFTVEFYFILFFFSFLFSFSDYPFRLFVSESFIPFL